MLADRLQWQFWTKLIVVAIGFTGGVVFMYVQCKVKTCSSLLLAVIFRITDQGLIGYDFFNSSSSGMRVISYAVATPASRA